MTRRDKIVAGAIAAVLTVSVGAAATAAMAASAGDAPFGGGHRAGTTMMGSGSGPGAMMDSGPMMGGASGAMMGSGSMMGANSGAMGMDFTDEFGYLTEMIPHHEEAITTAKLVLANTTHPELKALAENIIRTQTEQVAQMKAWLAAWYPGRDTHVDYQPMMRDLAKLSGDALDRTFLEDMARHHWWAVWASQKLVAQHLYQHQQLVPFATAGIRDPQRAQIHEMVGMLSTWFGESPMQVMAHSHS